MTLDLSIQLLSNLVAMQAGNEFGPIYSALSQGTLAAAIGEMTQHEMSSSIILALLELCVSKNTSNYTGMGSGIILHHCTIYRHYIIMMSS